MALEHLDLHLEDYYYLPLPSRLLVDPIASANYTDPADVVHSQTDEAWWFVLVLWFFLFCLGAAFVRFSCFLAASQGGGLRIVMVTSSSSWKQRRKEYIDHRLILKKVVRTKGCTTEPSSERNHEEPNERNDKNSSSIISSNTCRRQKSNLLLDDDDETNSRTCPICLGEYKEKEQICWSYNPQCSHVFHRSCAESWLLKHDECPCCRANYLMTNDYDDDDDRRSPLQPDEPISLLHYLRMLDRMSRRVLPINNNSASGISVDDSDYSSDTTSGVLVDSSRNSADATTSEVTTDDDIESQVSSSSSSEGRAVIEECVLDFQQ